jgi:hypothetical protein
MNYNVDPHENFDILHLSGPVWTPSLSLSLDTHADTLIAASKSLIIDFSQIEQMSEKDVADIIQLQEKMYQENLSMAMYGLQKTCKPIWAGIEETETLNLTPTQQESIDLVSMEGLEREFLNEEF